MALDYKSSLGRYRRYLQMVQSQPLWSASLWVILSLILLIVLLVLALRPTLITIADLVGKINQQKIVTAQLEERIVAVQNAISSMENQRDRISLLDEALPLDMKWSELAATLEAVAVESGISVENIVIGKIALTPTEIANNKSEKLEISSLPVGVIPVRFSITALGDFQSFRTLVERLEKKRRVMILTAVQISTDKTGALTIAIQGETSYLPDKFVL